mmetsp:Transcript_108661/g.307294  ORF Transcript_108661/g.307294 Transcript_108661/m.307294 type:complete len:358 (-) Transcript_108661:158-1231(-)
MPRALLVRDLDSLSRVLVYIGAKGDQEEEVLVDETLGPIVYLVDGSPSFFKYTPNSYSSMDKFYPGSGQAKFCKEWGDMGKTEREVAIHMVAKRNKSVRERVGLAQSLIREQAPNAMSESVWYPEKPRIIGRRLRVAALHGTCMNPHLLDSALQRLVKQGADRVELVHISGRQKAGPHHPAYAATKARLPDEDLLLYTEPDDLGAKDNMLRYEGLEDVAAYIQEEMAELLPIDGVLGFSQGAAVATVLAAQAVRGMGHPLAFVVHICSGGPAWPEQYPGLFFKPLQIPSLHVAGEVDFCMNSDGTPFLRPSLKVADLYAGPTVFRHPGGHTPLPPKTSDADEVVERILRFMEEAAAA